MNDLEQEPTNNPVAVKVIAFLMLVTVFRTQTILFIPELKMLEGPAPNGWLGPWVSDFVLGLCVPAMVYLALKSRSIKIWGILVLYNSVGAFDYSQGLITQWISPMPENMASSLMVYGGIGFFMICQLIALSLLFRSDVLNWFLNSNVHQNSR
ncbi:MAG: hypothetical protein AAF542_21055 [Pseudomonadota bacterium]